MVTGYWLLGKYTRRREKFKAKADVWYHEKMIAYLKGTLLHKEARAVILEVGGIGYAVHVGAETIAGLSMGSHAALWTHLAVRENSLDLYGFSARTDRDFFEQLISISGIGPKSALAIMNLAPTATLRPAIAGGDTTYLTKVSGIGKKMAQKIILELREKMAVEGKDSPGAPSDDTDVLEALVTLGYSARIARETLQKIDPGKVGVNERVKAALALLGTPRKNTAP